MMAGFIEGADRGQATLLPECLDDWVDESNPVRVIDAFVDMLDLRDLGFAGVDPAETGRPAYHPSVHLKLYIYGYLNRVQSSRRLEREAGRNLEVMWLLGPAGAGPQDDRRFPQGQRPGDQEGVRALRRAVPPRWACSRRRAWRSTAASSKPSITATRTSRRRRSSDGARNWRRASRAIWRSSTPPTGRSRRKRRR